MTQHNEVTLEDEICQALAAQGWIYEPDRKADGLYDVTRPLVPEALVPGPPRMECS